MYQQNPQSHAASQNADGRFILCTGLTLRLAGWSQSGGKCTSAEGRLSDAAS